MTGSNKAEYQSDPVRRYVVKPVLAPLSKQGREKEFPKDLIILLLGEAPDLGAALHAALMGSEYRVRQIVPGRKTRSLGKDRFEVDFSTLASIEALHKLFSDSRETVGSVFNLMGLSTVTAEIWEDHLDDAKKLFLLLKVFEKDLRKSAQAGGGWVVNFTGLDGNFGLGNGTKVPVNTAGTLGVTKTAGREWPELRVKCIDIDLETDPYMLISQVMEELTTDDPLVEVGLNREGRWRLDVVDVGDAKQDLSRPELDSDSVILVTGGAYGITADITKTLAEKYRPHLVLVGRSPMPEEEPENIRELLYPGILRQSLLQDLRAKDPKVTPVEVERAVNRVLKDRQIRTNLAAMEDAGARVEYHSLDVKDGEAFGNLIDEVYAKWGRIDGVIHGAGVIRDKLIRDKSLDAFDTVFKTKVIPANILEKKLRPEMLKFVMFFSSVAGRFGNVGQADYSAANEVLNKLADRLGHKWPDAHVVSINWGPWDSGMVSDILRRFYASNDIQLIPPHVGIRFAVNEIQRGRLSAHEVVIGSSIKQISERGLGR